MQAERISLLQRFAFAGRQWEVRNINRHNRLVLLVTVDGNRIKRVVVHFNAVRRMRRVS